MTSNSGESTPKMIDEILSYDINPVPQHTIVYGSLNEYLETLKKESKQQEIRKINHPYNEYRNPPQTYTNNKRVELFQSGSLLDFIFSGGGERKNPNLAPLNAPQIPVAIFRDSRQNQNPVFDFLGMCIPKEQKPSNQPSNFRSENLSGLQQSARYC
jgi:hypothetical protein